MILVFFDEGAEVDIAWMGIDASAPAGEDVVGMRDANGSDGVGWNGGEDRLLLLLLLLLVLLLGRWRRRVFVGTLTVIVIVIVFVVAAASAATAADGATAVIAPTTIASDW